MIHLERGELYEAAGEFERARKVMPGHPDPRVNLAIALEQAGRSEEALATFTAAIEVYPGYLPAIQGLACLALRESREDERLREWLEEGAMRTTEPLWRDWARRYLLGAQ